MCPQDRGAPFGAPLKPAKKRGAPSTLGGSQASGSFAFYSFLVGLVVGCPNLTHEQFVTLGWASEPGLGEAQPSRPKEIETECRFAIGSSSGRVVTILAQWNFLDLFFRPTETRSIRRTRRVVHSQAELAISRSIRHDQFGGGPFQG